MRWSAVIHVLATGAALAAMVSISGPCRLAAQDTPPTGPDAFERMRDYLARDGGRWRAPNPNGDPTDPTTPEAFGLWFEVSAQGRVLQLTVVNHFGSEVRRGSTSYWFWHPGDRRILYHEVRASGGVRMGRTYFEDPTTFITLTEAVGARGGNALNRGENVIVDEDVHATTAFELDERGDWVVQQSLTWTRSPTR